jgi:hypothetical protein
MEVYDRRGYCKEVGRLEKKVDGTVELFDKSGYNMGSVSEAKYTQMLLREADKNYGSKTTAPSVD